MVVRHAFPIEDVAHHLARPEGAPPRPGAGLVEGPGRAVAGAGPPIGGHDRVERLARVRLELTVHQAVAVGGNAEPIAACAPGPHRVAHALARHVGLEGGHRGKHGQIQAPVRGGKVEVALLGQADGHVRCRAGFREVEQFSGGAGEAREAVAVQGGDLARRDHRPQAGVLGPEARLRLAPRLGPVGQQQERAVPVARRQGPHLVLLDIPRDVPI
jgi:hypothetical protein